MQTILPYLLMPVMAGLLVLAQALWGSVVKHEGALQGSVSTIFVNLISNHKMWLGALIYIGATLIYFYMLSKLRFFSVQLAMTGLSVLFSTLLALFFFKENILFINYLGALVVLIGVGLVIYK